MPHGEPRSFLQASLPGDHGRAEPEVGREFLQERVALFAKVVLGLCLGFYVLDNLLASLVDGQPWMRWIDRPGNRYHLAACALQLAVWWAARRPGLSPALIRALDAAAIIILAVLFSLVAIMRDRAHEPVALILAMTNALLARAVMVPSEPFRTLWLGLAASAPPAAVTLVMGLRKDLPPQASPLYLALRDLLWYGVAVAATTLTSRVIYGLHRQVREARRLGQYTILEKIGAGAMGEVYKARHALLRRPTAVKLIRRELTGERSLARFEREVQLTSRLTHPNTIAIYDYGRTHDGIFYYAMEYLPGVSLEDLVKSDGPQPPDRVIHILKQVCASLAEAHGVGLVHRDIKAANVILCERGGVQDVVKVLDFGLVKELGEHGDPGLSGEHTITGTPLYLSPEAIRSPREVDARSDLYSVGVLGYHLLTGAALFDGRSLAEIYAHHLHTAPVPPSARLAASVPPDLEAVILRCLAKDPAARFKDARALLEALEACRDAGGWGAARARAWWDRFPVRMEATRRSSPAATVDMAGNGGGNGARDQGGPRGDEIPGSPGAAARSPSS